MLIKFLKRLFCKCRTLNLHIKGFAVCNNCGKIHHPSHEEMGIVIRKISEIIKESENNE